MQIFLSSSHLQVTDTTFWGLFVCLFVCLFSGEEYGGTVFRLQCFPLCNSNILTCLLEYMNLLKVKNTVNK